MTLAGKFGIFRRKMKLDEMPEDQALYIQGVYVAGAQAAFQLVIAMADKTPEESVIAMGELQSEILNAMPKPEEKRLVMLPGERPN